MKLPLMASAAVGLGMLPVWAEGSTASAATSQMPSATAQRLKDEGAIPPDTRVAGASGGAIGAAVSANTPAANTPAAPSTARPAGAPNDARTDSAEKTNTSASTAPRRRASQALQPQLLHQRWFRGSTAPTTRALRSGSPQTDLRREQRGRHQRLPWGAQRGRTPRRKHPARAPYQRPLYEVGVR